MSAPAQEPTPRAGVGTFGSLRVPNFRYLWLGQISHAGALWMEVAARPFLIFSMTENGAVHLGAVTAVRTLPQLMFGLGAGVVSDWFDRRAILLIVKSAVLAINVAFATLIIAGALELWHLYAYAFLRGSLMAFDQPARQSMIPSVVGPERVTNAIALMSATQNTMRIAGAALGGLVYAWLGPEGAFAGIAAIYVGAVVFTWMLDIPTHERPGPVELSAMGRGLVEGLRFAWHDPAIRGVLLLTGVYFTFGMSYMQVFLPLFAEEIFDVGSLGFGLLAALSGAGAVVAAIAIASRQPTRLGTILPAVVVLFGATLMAFSLATYLPRPAGLWLPAVLILLVGGMQTSFFSLSRSLMLHAAPEQMRGRVLSLLSLDRAFMTAGAASAGVLAAAVGVQLAQTLYAGVCIAATLVLVVLAPSFRRVTTTYAPATGLPEATAPLEGALEPSPGARSTGGG